jgi:hypothetical protein
VAFLDSWQWGIFMAIITLYTLFFDDIRVIACPPPWDPFFYFLTCSFLVIFSAEIIIACYVKPGYIFSFFFWLDILATLSMLFDIGWLMDSLNVLFTGGGGDSASKAAKVASTSRAARVTRIVRLVRLIRLVRIVKLYKQA